MCDTAALLEGPATFFLFCQPHSQELREIILMLNDLCRRWWGLLRVSCDQWLSGPCDMIDTQRSVFSQLSPPLAPILKPVLQPPRPGSHTVPATKISPTPVIRQNGGCSFCDSTTKGRNHPGAPLGRLPMMSLHLFILIFRLPQEVQRLTKQLRAKSALLNHLETVTSHHRWHQINKTHISRMV